MSVSEAGCGLPRFVRAVASVTPEMAPVAGGNETSMVSPPCGRARVVELGTVRSRDRLDDGESQSVTALVLGTGAAQSLEGLEETLDLLGRDGRAGIRDGHEGVLVAGPGRDLDVSSRGVVADRVVEQVGDQPLEGVVDRRLLALGRAWRGRRVRDLRALTRVRAWLGRRRRPGRGARGARARPARGSARAGRRSAARRSCSEASTRSWALRSESTFASEPASATSLSARRRVSGARSWCTRRWRTN